MNLQDNDFALFGLPERFAQDGADLERRWKALQREVHPDRHSADSPAEQRLAMQWSVRVNEAYQRLKDPLKRAAYLCELRGVPINAEHNTAMPAAFLMQQMQWRESLEEARGAEDLEGLHRQTRASQADLLGEIARCLDQPVPQVAQAASAVRALMFVRRFTQDVEQKLDALTA